MRLGCNLDFADKSGSVLVRALDIDPYVLLPGERIDVFCVGVGEIDNLVFRDEFLEEKLKEPFPVFRAERSFEPVVQQNAGISPDKGFLRHN